MSTNGMFSGKFQHRALAFNLALFQLAPVLVSWDDVPVVQEASFGVAHGCQSEVGEVTCESAGSLST